MHFNLYAGNTFVWSNGSRKHVLGKHPLTLNTQHSHRLPVECWFDGKQEGLYFRKTAWQHMNQVSVKSVIWYSNENRTRIVDLVFHWKDWLYPGNRCVFVCVCQGLDLVKLLQPQREVCFFPYSEWHKESKFTSFIHLHTVIHFRAHTLTLTHAQKLSYSTAVKVISS